MGSKIYRDDSVFQATEKRLNYVFDNFERVVVSFSGGKDSSVMLNMAASIAKKRGLKIGVMVIDLEAQYKATIAHIEHMRDFWGDTLEFYWICLPMSLRNAASNFEPKWICWDEDKRSVWVRDMPSGVVSDPTVFPFFQ